MSINNMGGIISSQIGAALTNWLGVTAHNLGIREALNPTPYTLHPTPYTPKLGVAAHILGIRKALHPKPYTLHLKLVRAMCKQECKQKRLTDMAHNLDNFWKLVLICNLSTLLPLVLISWIPVSLSRARALSLSLSLSFSLSVPICKHSKPCCPSSSSLAFWSLSLFLSLYPPPLFPFPPIPPPYGVNVEWGKEEGK